MTAPVRLQLSRRKGFRLQDASAAVNGLPAQNVARPSLFGNMFRVIDDRSGSGQWIVTDEKSMWLYEETRATAQREAVRCYKEALNQSDPISYASWRAEIDRIMFHLPVLTGKNLACWCGLDLPCHVDVILQIANPICEEVRP